MEFPDTRESLLVQLRSGPNGAAWDQFALIYQPLIYRLARGRGLQDADAQDLVQQVLIAVAASIDRWERANPSVRFHHWLRTVARNAIVNALSRRPHDYASGGSAALDWLLEQPDADDQLDTSIETELRRGLYLRAAQIVRCDVEAETWLAFEWTVVEGQSIQDAATMLDKSVGSIYAARSRVMHRLRQAVQKLEREEP